MKEKKLVLCLLFYFSFQQKHTSKIILFTHIPVKTYKSRMKTHRLVRRYTVSPFPSQFITQRQSQLCGGSRCHSQLITPDRVDHPVWRAIRHTSLEKRGGIRELLEEEKGREADGK